MEIIYKKIKDIKPYEKNPRNNKAAVDFVANSIREFGFKVPIVIDKNGVIVAGHTRYKASQKLNLKEVPAVIADDLNEEQIKAFRLADNKTAEKAEWDFDLLTEELDGIFDIDMDDFGFEFEGEEAEEIGENEEDEQEDEEQLFKERMARGEISEEDEEYQEFLQKFELKKTTDDCYTPDNIYEVVKNWCLKRFDIKGRKIVRPFYPGGDYQNENYAGCVVIDNPPFSIISEICDFYTKNKIPYFLFAPSLTLLGIMRGEAKYVACNASVTYENGANVNTSFVTNMGNKKIITSADLYRDMTETNKENLRKLHRELPKYSYPDEVLTSMMLCYIAAHGVDLEIEEKDLHFIRALDAQKEAGKGLYGSGFLLSEKAAAEKAAAEKTDTMVWQLSEREWEIVKNLGSEMSE